MVTSVPVTPAPAVGVTPAPTNRGGQIDTHVDPHTIVDPWSALNAYSVMPWEVTSTGPRAVWPTLTVAVLAAGCVAPADDVQAEATKAATERAASTVVVRVRRGPLAVSPGVRLMYLHTDRSSETFN
jgi:hypothetical protein